MSVYGSDRRQSVCSGDDGNFSVGERMLKGQMFTLNHPLYISFAEAVSEELENLRQENLSARQAADKLLITSTLPSEEVDVLSSWYPEFDTILLPLNSPVQPLWCAARQAANELAVTSIRTYAGSVLHLGGSRLSNVVNSRENCDVMYDHSDPVQADIHYSEAVDLHRIFLDHEKASETTGLALDREQYDKMLREEAYFSCDSRTEPKRTSEGVCIDLSVMDVSPTQFALTMLAQGAEIGYGFLIYHPNMLVRKEAELPGTGVSFEITSDQVRFHYPQGAVGVAAYCVHNWRSWITSHNFCVGLGKDKRWFALELLDTRGPFLNFRMVALDEEPMECSYRHAMELADAKDYVLVKSWRLKDGLKSNPKASEDWQAHEFLVSSRVEKRVREFAMQLKPEAFKRETVKKQIRVVNNRWVLKGSEVIVMPLMDPREIEDLTTAIFSRVFVDRYESGALSTAMMNQLRKVADFHSTGTLGKISMVAGALTRQMYEQMVGPIASALNDISDYIVDLLSPAKRMKVETVPPPTYLMFESGVEPMRQQFLSSVTKHLQGFAHTRATPNLVAPCGRLMKQMCDMVSDKVANSYINVVREITDYEDIRVTNLQEPQHPAVDLLVDTHEMDQPSNSRFEVEMTLAERRYDDPCQEFEPIIDADPVASMNGAYGELFPSVAQSVLEFDSWHMSLDPQDFTIEAPYLKMPTYFGLAPPPREAFRSKLMGLNIPRKQNTSVELLNAILQRNCSAPVISLPQEDSVIIPDIWNTFLDSACVPDARVKLKTYQEDPLACSEQQFADWTAHSGKVSSMCKIVMELKQMSRSVSSMGVSEYLGMLKTDVKPTLSEKPVREVTAPQVIVYHEKLLSAFYSSIFRVLTNRLLSLLKSTVHCNLRKSLEDIGAWVSSVHPYGHSGLRYLENDFSKFDKSQSRFVFELEEYVFRQLGLNEEMLEKWCMGHVDCSIRAVSLGLSLHVMYQRKSGDATTALGNVILNMLSVFYAYKGTEFHWAVFMGDDSLVCTDQPVQADIAVRVLAEIFNLSAKYYLTEAPYFASTFFLVDSALARVRLVPDPIKRIERLSMHIAALDPQWRERFISYRDSLGAFLDPTLHSQLARAVSLRYDVTEGSVRAVAQALATVISREDKFRALWDSSPTVLQG